MFDAIKNELQYRLGTEAGLKGNLQKDAATNTYEPTFIQKALGVTSEQLTTAANRGAQNRFNATEMGQEAASYGIEIGSGAPNLTKIRKSLGKAKQREALGQKITMLGGEVGDVTDIGVLAEMVDTLDTDRANTKVKNSPQWQQQETRYNDTRTDQLEAFKLARADIDYNREESAARRSFDKRESALGRRHQQELEMLSGNRTMAIAEMNADLADKRMSYDRETRRMDKRDQMIAQLMSGLGGLGAAFG